VISVGPEWLLLRGGTNADTFRKMSDRSYRVVLTSKSPIVALPKWGLNTNASWPPAPKIVTFVADVVERVVSTSR